MSHACHRCWKCHKTLTFCSLLKRCTFLCPCHAKRYLNVQKWSKPLVFNILTSKSASCRNGLHFFDISTSKSALNLSVFYTFDFEMCFAPRWRALFRHLNFQKCSEPVSFLHYWLRNVLRDTTACTFSTSQLPKAEPDSFLHFWLRNVLALLEVEMSKKCRPLWREAHVEVKSARNWRLQSTFGSWDVEKVQAVVAHLNPSVFYTFDFEMCFAPQRRALFWHLNVQKWSRPGVFCTFCFRNVLRATTACKFSSLLCPAGSAPAALASLRSHKSWGKRSVSRLSYLFAHLDLLPSETFSFLIFFLLLFSSLTLPISAFHLSILSEVWLLNFLR